MILESVPAQRRTAQGDSARGGVGRGSSDAAAVLSGLERALGIGADRKNLAILAAAWAATCRCSSARPPHGSPAEASTWPRRPCMISWPSSTCRRPSARPPRSTAASTNWRPRAPPGRGAGRRAVRGPAADPPARTHAPPRRLARLAPQRSGRSGIPRQPGFRRTHKAHVGGRRPARVRDRQRERLFVLCDEPAEAAGVSSAACPPTCPAGPSASGPTPGRIFLVAQLSELGRSGGHNSESCATRRDNLDPAEKSRREFRLTSLDRSCRSCYKSGLSRPRPRRQQTTTPSGSIPPADHTFGAVAQLGARPALACRRSRVQIPSAPQSSPPITPLPPRGE